MGISESERRAVTRFSALGYSSTRISEVLGIPRSTVIYTLKRYKDTGSHENKPKVGRPVSVSTQGAVNKIRKRLGRNSKRSMRKMAASLGMARETVRKIIRKKLQMYPYKLQKSHILTDKMKSTRLRRCKSLLRRLANGRHMSVVWSDEKLFTVEESVNKQNDRILAKSLSEASSSRRIVSRSQHPKRVMVWAAVTSNGKSPLIFVEEGVKINATVYQNDILKSGLVPWSEKHFGNKPWIFQQDSAPAHRARTTQTWLKTHVPDFISPTEWPPCSPDINPLDFSVWGILQSKVGSRPYTSVEALKASLVKAWEEINVELLRDICDSVPRRLKKCVAARGGLFEL